MKRLPILLALLAAACLAPAALAQSTFETGFVVEHSFDVPGIRAAAPAFYSQPDRAMLMTVSGTFGSEFTGYAHDPSSPSWEQFPYAAGLETNPNADYSNPHEWRVRVGQFDADAGLEYFVRWRTLNTVQFRIFDSPGVSGLVTHPKSGSWRSANPAGANQQCGYLPLDVVSLGDLDGDGNPEMVTINTSNESPAPGCPNAASAQVNVIEWQPETGKIDASQQAHFRFVEGLDVAVGNNQLRYIAAGDPDGDGRTEIVVVAAQNGGNPGGLYVFEVNPAGFDDPGVGVLVPDGGPANAEPFASQVGISTNGAIGSGSATVSGGQGGLHIADLDGDGIDEIVIAYAGTSVSSGVRVYSLSGTNGAGDPNYVGTQAAQFLTTASAAVGFFDEDGRTEIYTTNLQSDGIRSMEHVGAVGDFSPSAFRTFTNASELGAGLGLIYAAPDADGSTLDSFSPSLNDASHPDADDPRPELMAFGRNALHLLEALPSFAPLDLDLLPLGRPVGAVGDANGDGVRDIVLMGEGTSSATLLTGAVEAGGALSYASSQPFLSRVLGDVVWFDADNDGHLDLAYTGGSTIGGGGAVNLIVMQNDGSGGFTELLRIERGVRLGDIEVLDYDFDGDQDLLMMGDPFEGGTPALTTLFRNRLDEGTIGFGRDTEHGLPALSYARAASVRLDGGTDSSDDDRLLLALQGRTSDGSAYAGVWSRAPGDDAFANENAPVVALQNGDVAWIDVIGDAQPDLILSGSLLLANGGDPIRETLVYENTPGVGGRTFQPSSSTLVRGLPATDTRYLAPADFDRDGLTDLVLRTPSLADETQDRFDIFLQRRSGSGSLVATTFEPLGLRLGLSGRDGGTTPLVLVADLDGDSYEDLLLSGRSFLGGSVNQTTVFRNTMTFADPTAIGGAAAGSAKRMDDALSAPTGLTADASANGDVTLAWNAATRTDRVKSESLTYAVSVGTSVGATDIVAPLADLGSGFRKAMSTQRNFSTSHRLSGLAPGTYHWGVQTVYGSLSSPFASGTFVVGAPTGLPALSLDAPTNGADELIVQPGDLITFDLNVGNLGRPAFGPVEDLAGVGLQILFADEVVDFVDVEFGDDKFLNSFSGTVSSVSIEDNENTLLSALALAIARTSDTGVSGSGTVATVTFRVRTDFEGFGGGEAVNALPFVIDNVLAVDPNGDEIELTPIDAIVGIAQVVVWPGDTDASGSVEPDASDLIPIGTHFGKTGPERGATASFDWTGQPVLPWSYDATPSVAHADASGDGVVDQNDVLAIGLNWMQTRLQPLGKTGTVAATCPTSLDLGAVAVGAQIAFSVDIAEAARGVSYGFELPAGLSVVDVATLGSLESDDQLSFHKQSERTLGVAFVRTSDEELRQGERFVVTLEAESALSSATVTLSSARRTSDSGLALLCGTKLATSTLVAGADASLPTHVELSSPAPNPARGVTRIGYALPRASDVRITVYDATGRLVQTLVSGTRPAGTHDVRLDASALPSGLYLYRMEADGIVRSGRVTVLR